MDDTKTQWHWDTEKVKTASPEQLIENIKGYLEHINGLIVDKRATQPTTEEFTHFLEDILLNKWGIWSRDMNIIVRKRIKEMDLFIEDDDKRFISKQLSVVYLYWTKCHRYLESTFTDNVVLDALKIAKTFGEMNHVYDYFYKLEKTKNGGSLNV